MADKCNGFRIYKFVFFLQIVLELFLLFLVRLMSYASVGIKGNASKFKVIHNKSFTYAIFLIVEFFAAWYKGLP